ncbi:MAG: hypothetical protein KKF68_00795 [Nanoarchaeota archaeon]|nr:hypothetical protein [Nanoarchaeota archaeon]
MEKGDYTISDIYQGGYSTFDSNKGYGNVFTGYRASAKTLGMSTDARTANALKEISEQLSSGIQTVEMSMVSPEVFESIPTQQLTEINRLSKLTGSDITVHAPVVEASGITEQGWNEINREKAERQMKFAIERAHEVNPDKSSPVTFHSSAGIPGTEWKTIPWGEKKIKGEEQRLIVINQETGKMAPLEEERKYYPEMKELRKELTAKDRLRYQQGKIKETEIYKDIPLEKGKYLSPEQRLKMLNDTEWDNSLSQILFNKERADEILQKNQVQIQHLMQYLQEGREDGKIISPENLTPTQKQAWSHFENARVYLEDTHQHLYSLFSKAYEYGNPQQREELKKISEKFKKQLPSDPGDVAGQSKAMQTLLINLKERKVTPNMYIPIEEFAINKSSETFANVAFNSYKKFKNNAPVVSIENPPAGGGLSTGEDLKNLVEASREKFIERLIKEEKVSRSEAKKQAEKLIGITWDVGHINMLKGQGFEDKDIIKESEKVAPYLKHVHLSDNFGLQHTELPMGMGNVPLKGIMEKLGKKGFEAKKIIEAVSWWQHFSPGGKHNSPFGATLEAIGSPIYTEGVGPYWNQALGFQQGYAGGYGMMLPQTNYDLFGAGFSQLPAELGGQRPGGRGGRMSGNPME